MLPVAMTDVAVLIVAAEVGGVAIVAVAWLEVEGEREEEKQ